MSNLDRVISNSRFFIHNAVHAPHLASHVLGKALRRVKHDWSGRFGKEPLLVETFVEQSRFTGTCYRASNWIHIGTTAGRGRQDAHHKAELTPKEMYVYPLHRRWREMLGGSRANEPPLFSSGDWAEQEWGNAQLGDTRLVQRLVSLGRDRYALPQASIPQTCGSRAKTKAAYRFFDHERATLQNLLAPHIEATTNRVAKENIVLAIQDTTSLNYSTHPATENLGPIGSSPTYIVGLMLHGTLAEHWAELVQLKVDVLVAQASSAIGAAQKATTTIPIVMATTGDPLGSGFVKSLARPEGNIASLVNDCRLLCGEEHLLGEACWGRGIVENQPRNGR
jgi:hypothetical protein